MSRETYATAGKKKLVDFLVENKNRHYTVEEIAERIPEIGKSSVYRLIGKLHAEGSVRRFEAEGSSSFVYQYVENSEACEHHFHLKCIRCGKVIHMECRQLEFAKRHIEENHGFLIGMKNSMIYGQCSSCMGEDAHG